MSWRTTEPLTTVRAVADDSRAVEGIAVPYGQIATDVEGGPEAFAPGAFRASVEHWAGRQDGARMAFRPAHREKPVGTVTSLEDAPDGVRFRATIFDTPAGDEYLGQVRAGLNGVSIEFAPGKATRRMRDGTVLHRDARMHAIAGSISPAYDGARIALRDMEDPEVSEETTTTPETPAPETPERDATIAATSAERVAVETRDVARFTAPAVVTRPEAVYGRTTGNDFLRDLAASHNGDSEAQERQARHQRHQAHRQLQLARAHQVERMDGQERTQPAVHRVPEAQHAALPQQHVVGQAGNDGDAHLRQHGHRQIAGEHQGGQDQHQGKQAPDDPAADVVGFEFVNSSHVLTLACAQKTLGPEDQNQHEK